MDKQQLRDLLAQRETNGEVPAVQVVPEGKRTIDSAIRHCRCGCHGDWTEHTMRLGERGIYGNEDD